MREINVNGKVISRPVRKFLRFSSRCIGWRHCVIVVFGEDEYGCLQTKHYVVESIEDARSLITALLIDPDCKQWLPNTPVVIAQMGRILEIY